MPSFGPKGSVSSGSPLAGVRGNRPIFRADLHVHSHHSGPGHMRVPGIRAGVGEPRAIYRVAKARGLGLVTLTDLDTIDGCLEFLDRYPDTADFMISEEITAADPRTGRTAHLLVYDINEAQHGELQRRRRDLRELLDYVHSERIVASLSPFAGGPLPPARIGAILEDLVALFEHIEIKNGALGRSHNDLVARVVQTASRGRSVGLTAGSGTHGSARVGSAVTASFATSPSGFMQDLREHRTWAFGEDGTLRASSADLSRIIAEGYRAFLRPGSERAVRGGGDVVRALLALPLHLVGTPFWRDGLRRARASTHLRRERRRLDRIDIEQFQERTRSYGSASLAVEPASPEVL